MQTIITSSQNNVSLCLDGSNYDQLIHINISHSNNFISIIKSIFKRVVMSHSRNIKFQELQVNTFNTLIYNIIFALGVQLRYGAFSSISHSSCDVTEYL